MTRSIPIVPKERESADAARWSPITKSWPAGTTQRAGSSVAVVGCWSYEVRLVELHVVHPDRAVLDLDDVAGQPDDALDERRALGPLRPGVGRLEDHDVAAAVRVEAGVSLSTRTYWSGSRVPFHRHLLDAVRLGHERLDHEEDDERQDERLDDLEEAPEGAFGHKSGSIGAGVGRRPTYVRPVRWRSDAGLRRGCRDRSAGAPAGACVGLRPGRPRQHRPRVPGRRLAHRAGPGRPAAPTPRAHPGLLRQLRLALLRGDALAAGSPSPCRPRGDPGGGDPGRARGALRRGEAGRGGAVHRRSGQPEPRAAVRLGVGPRPRARARLMGRPRRTALGGTVRAARRCARLELPGLASARHVPGSIRGPHEQRLRDLAGARARARSRRGRRRGAARCPGRRGPPLVRRGRRLPGCLGTVRVRLPVARPGRRPS